MSMRLPASLIRVTTYPEKNSNFQKLPHMIFLIIYAQLMKENGQNLKLLPYYSRPIKIHIYKIHTWHCRSVLYQMQTAWITNLVCSTGKKCFTLNCRSTEWFRLRALLMMKILVIPTLLHKKELVADKLITKLTEYISHRNTLQAIRQTYNRNPLLNQLNRTEIMRTKMRLQK